MMRYDVRSLPITRRAIPHHEFCHASACRCELPVRLQSPHYAFAGIRHRARYLASTTQRCAFATLRTARNIRQMMSREAAR